MRSTMNLDSSPQIPHRNTVKTNKLIHAGGRNDGLLAERHVESAASVLFIDRLVSVLQGCC